VPFWLVAAQAGWRGMVEVWPACLVTGLSFGIAQFLVSNLHGPWLVDIIAAVFSMVALVLFLRGGQPSGDGAETRKLVTSGRFRAWLPWILLSVFVAVWK